MAVKELLSKRIKQLRADRGWTQEVLAAETTLSPREIQYLESGKHWPGFDTIEKLALGLKIDDEELFDFTRLDTSKKSLPTGE